jgi:hypothetical protein
MQFRDYFSEILIVVVEEDKIGDRIELRQPS